MKFVIQRVQKASVEIEGKIFSEISQGLLILFCAEKGDENLGLKGALNPSCNGNLANLDYFIGKILKLRIFEDEAGKMNKSLLDIGGEILVVSQFTLAASCKKGTRPSFEGAMEPVLAKKMYEEFVEGLKIKGRELKREMGLQNIEMVVKTGVFAADMQVGLVNDGPVTIIL